MSDNYEEYAPYRWHPCKKVDDCNVEECTAKEAEFFGVYCRDEESSLLHHYFDCVTKWDAKRACLFLHNSFKYENYLYKLSRL